MCDNGSVIKKTTLSNLKRSTTVGMYARRFRDQTERTDLPNWTSNELEVVKDNIITTFAKLTKNLNSEQRRCVAKQLAIAFGIAGEKLDE